MRADSVESNDSENMMSGLGSVKKEVFESSVMFKQHSGFASEMKVGGDTTIEYLQRGLTSEGDAFKGLEDPLHDSNNDDEVELGKAAENEVDFTDSDEDDVNVKFSEKILKQGNKTAMESAKQSAMIH
jgi:hypothetical protein